MSNLRNDSNLSKTGTSTSVSGDGSSNVEVDAQMPPKPLRYTFYEQLQKMLENSFSFVAALAWNQAVSALFTQLFGSKSSGNTIGLFLYAFMVTIIVVGITYFICVFIRKIQEYDRRITNELIAERERLKIRIRKDILKEQSISETSTGEKENKQGRSSRAINILDQ